MVLVRGRLGAILRSNFHHRRLNISNVSEAELEKDQLLIQDHEGREQIEPMSLFCFTDRSHRAM